MGHIGQKFTFGDAGFFSLPPHPLNLIDIGFYVGHIKNQDYAALNLSVFIYNMLAVTLVMLPVDGKAPGNVFVEHILAEVLQHTDIFAQLVVRQMSKDIRGSPVIADQSVVVIQCNDTVAQTFQDFLGRQMAEIIITAAPDHNNHHGHGNGQRHGSQVKYLHDF